ncbi:MAG: bifunctional metallophosphatase/5'-nucleotidase [Rhodospirillaceae bacterium]
MSDHGSIKFWQEIGRRNVLRVAMCGAAAWLAIASPSSAQDAAGVIDVAILAINDLHGNLMPPAGGIAIAGPGDPAKKIAVPAGGVEYMATLVHQLRAGNRNTIFVAAGDLIGASPLLSALFHDVPTVESLSLMGLEVSAVGNHEFDKGPAELLRMQNGGCHPQDGCKGSHPFAGAKYRYLAASTRDMATGKTIFPPYYVKSFDGVPIAFIGLTTKTTPDIVVHSGTAGLAFEDEAKTVNALVPELRAKGIEAIVVLIHEGGAATGDYNACPGISGRILEIVPKLDRAIDVVISGHTHQAYNCVIDGRLVTSAHRYGTLVTKIDLRLDAKTRDVISAKAENLIVRDDRYAKDPEQTKLLAGYATVADGLSKRVVGAVTAPLGPEADAAGESTLGDVIADAELAATAPADKGGAQIAFMNPGGIRTGLAPREGGQVTYGDLFAVQPFGNRLVTVTLTGAQIKALLEQQWSNPARASILQVSKGFSYRWDAARATGEKVLPGSISLGGKTIDPGASYRVTGPDIIAEGGNGFSVLSAGEQRLTGPVDLAATEAYLQAHKPLSPPSLQRVRRVN